MRPEAMMRTRKTLKLFGMTQAVDELARQGSPARLAAAPVLDGLVKAEVTDREERSVNYQMKAC